jgi:hypothetical protein
MVEKRIVGQNSNGRMEMESARERSVRRRIVRSGKVGREI